MCGKWLEDLAEEGEAMVYWWCVLQGSWVWEEEGEEK